MVSIDMGIALLAILSNGRYFLPLNGFNRQEKAQLACVDTSPAVGGVGPRTHRSDSGYRSLSTVGISFL
jgi:hypothetical protein